MSMYDIPFVREKLDDFKLFAQSNSSRIPRYCRGRGPSLSIPSSSSLCKSSSFPNANSAYLHEDSFVFHLQCRATMHANCWGVQPLVKLERLVIKSTFSNRNHNRVLIFLTAFRISSWRRNSIRISNVHLMGTHETSDTVLEYSNGLCWITVDSASGYSNLPGVR